VPGIGPANSNVAIVGQGPGELEAHQTRPFVGDAGIRLDDWLYRARILRKDIWITNVVLCWHTRKGVKGQDVSRLPTWEEREFCWHAHVKGELSSLASLQVIVPVGIPAMEVFLGKSTEKDAGSLTRIADRDQYLAALDPQRGKAKQGVGAVIEARYPDRGYLFADQGPRGPSDQRREDPSGDAGDQ